MPAHERAARRVADLGALGVGRRRERGDERGLRERRAAPKRVYGGAEKRLRRRRRRGVAGVVSRCGGVSRAVVSRPAVGGGSRARAHAPHRRLRECVQEHQGPAPRCAGRRAPRVHLEQIAVLLPQRLRPQPGGQRVVPQVREHADLVLVLHHAAGAHDAPRGVEHGVAEHLERIGGVRRRCQHAGRGGSRM